MEERRRKSLSKFLSLILRHQPERVGIQLDPQGWVEMEKLLSACAKHGRKISREEIVQVVQLCDKQRFAISPDGKKIRANYGHSIPVRPDYEAQTPPDVLYHGTSARSLPSIFREGIKKQKRQFVHLTTSKETALKVGSRYGQPVLLIIDAKQMFEDGYVFYSTQSGEIWLTEYVPVKYLIWDDFKMNQ